MLKLGILLDAGGIKATSDQAQKLESFVNFWLKKHYLSKENVEKDYILKENVKKDYILKENVEKDYILKESIKNIDQSDVETQTENEISKEQREKENEMELDFPKFYKSSNLRCPLCFNFFSMGKLMMHVKSCIG